MKEALAIRNGIIDDTLLVSTEGKFWRLFKGGRRRKIGGANHGGYLRYIHKGHYSNGQRLVWETFKGRIPDGWVIDHLNMIKTDNRLSNLEAITRYENSMRAINHESTDNLSDDEHYQFFSLFANGHSKAAIGRKFGCDVSLVGLTLFGKNRKYLLRRWIEEGNEPFSPRKITRLTDEEAYEVFALRDKGYTYEEIGDELGIDPTTAHKIYLGRNRPQLREAYLGKG